MRRWMIVALVVFAVACRTSYFVRTGDAAYKRGDYAEALENYESERRHQPSRDIDEKIAATKIKLVEQELQPIEAAFAEGRFDEGVTGLLALDAETQEQPPVQAFKKKQEQRLLEELGARAGRKEWGRAFVLASRAVKVFPTIADTVPEYARSWADALRAAITDADKNKKDGARVVLRAALAVATGDANDRAQAKRLLDEVRRKYALAVEVKGKGDLARVRSALSTDARFAISGATASGKITITLGAPTDTKAVSRGRESARVQKATRTVENPERAQLQAILDDKEDALAHWKRQQADEMQSPTRTKESVEGYDYPIRVAQEDVDEARENLRSAPATIQEPNIVEVPFEVETHTLTVARDVSIAVDAKWQGELSTLRDTVKLAKSDKAHAANSEAGIGRDPVELPVPSSLGRELDAAVVRWLESPLEKITGQYYRRLLVDLAKPDGVALVITLYPQGVHRQHVERLEKATGVPMGAEIIDALARDRLAYVFEEAAPATTAKTTAPAKTAAPSKTAATTTTPTSKTPAPAPVDPMLAKAGYSLAIAPFKMTRKGKVVLEVGSDGALRSGATTIGTLRANGTVVDPDGKILLAFDKKGELWMPRQEGSAGRLSSASLAFGEATLSFDKAGHVRLVHDGKARVSEAVLSPNVAKVKPAAIIVAWLGIGKLGMRAE